MGCENTLSLSVIKRSIEGCLRILYRTDGFLLRRNNNRGVCERCLVFRFAHYLQNQFDDHFVDCDFNSSFSGYPNKGRDVTENKRSGKPIKNENGSVTRRFVDIVIHKRDCSSQNNLVCFEIKKWNTNNKKERNKDYNNLRRLTSDYGYSCGLHIVFGKSLAHTRWTIFQKGHVVKSNVLVFQNETK